MLALALFVFICYHAAGVWRRGIIGHPIKVVKGHVAFLAPINIVEEIAKPISLSLRLFGNIFAGGILVGADRAVPAGTSSGRPTRSGRPSTCSSV